jgi:hypothetical protein
MMAQSEIDSLRMSLANLAALAGRLTTERDQLQAANDELRAENARLWEKAGRALKGK